VGLAICRRLIEAHGGTLRAAQNPAGGALFEFTLPLAPAESG
jgi:two-component system sensor histidine kinase KdpD